MSEPEPWRNAWRAIQQSHTTVGLKALAVALECDKRLCQGYTCETDLSTLKTDQATAHYGCATCFPGWQDSSLNLKSCGQLHAYAQDIWRDANDRLHDPTGSYDFICWWDEAERALAFRLLLAEVLDELMRREARDEASTTGQV